MASERIKERALKAPVTEDEAVETSHDRLEDSEERPRRTASNEQFERAHRKTTDLHARLFRRLAE